MSEQRHIVIVDNRGLTFVGMVDFGSPTYPKTIRDAKCVIRWGTSGHLAELAAHGPTKSTVFGKERDFTMHDIPIGSYVCSEEWDV